VHSLDALLKEEGSLLHEGTLDRIALARCRALQSELPKPKEVLKFLASKSLIPGPAIGMPLTATEIDAIHTIAPWTESSIPQTLPKLPAILKPALAKATFTHAGSLPTGASPSGCYERLEWVGDAYLYLLSTLLISRTFPALGPGKAAQMRERLVKNKTLASYAKKYEFEKRWVVPADVQNMNDYEKTKILGDIFEAYVAAVIQSDPKDGVRIASQWLKGLWAITLAEEIKESAPKDGDVVDNVLPVPTLQSAKQELQKALVSRNIRLHYKDIGQPTKDSVTGFPLYTVGVYLEGWGEKNKLLGTGSALSKKEAGWKAAEAALQKDLYEYKEKKRIFDEMTKARKDAEAAAAAAKEGEKSE
jgi:ribonuclease-3